MTTGYIKGKNGYDIPYVAEIDKASDKILIMAHGFSSSKGSPTVKMIMGELPARGIGVIAFDFPGHGESPVDGDMLTVDHCVDDLKAVGEFVRADYPDAEICYFGSSFGAYITLHYLMKYHVDSAKAFLRSAAVNMHEIFLELTEEQRASLESYGYFIDDYGMRPLKVTREFVEDLKEHDLFKAFASGNNQIKMIHGTDDDDIEYGRAKEFADKYHIEMITVPGGDHMLSIPGAPEKVLAEALSFLKQSGCGDIK